MREQVTILLLALLFSLFDLRPILLEFSRILLNFVLA